MTEMLTSAWTNPDLDKTPAELVAERAKRVDDAFDLKVPDRIPILVGISFLAAEMAGLPHSAVYKDTALQRKLVVDAAKRFGPDSTIGPWHDPRPSLAVGDRMTRWPGYTLPDNSSYQFDEHEFMKAEDYPAFLEDSSDWAIRAYLPRAFSELEGLAMLPPLGMSLFGYYNFLLNGHVWGLPPVQQALKALMAAGEAQLAWLGEQAELTKALIEEAGVPPASFLQVMTEAPFDFMSDTLRGMRGIFLDLRQRPKELLAAQDRVLKFQMDYALGIAKILGAKQSFIPLHRGSGGFMSIEQFDTFYWPTLEAMILQYIDAGIKPVVFYEGIWDAARLERLARLPKGKSVGLFQNSDMALVKDMVGDVMAIGGGLPNSLLRTGPASMIREKTHEICEVLGKNGGFMMSTYVMEMEGCDPDLIDVWVNATKEYGVY